MIACSGIYVDDCEANMLGPIFTRINRKRYHVLNLISVFILTFILIFVPLLSGYLISLISNPIFLAMDNVSATPTFFIKSFASNLLKQWEIFNPILFTFFHMFLSSMIFSIFACLGYVISMIINWNRFISIITVFIFYIAYNIFFTIIGHAEITFFNLIEPYSMKISIVQIGILLLVFVILILILFKVFLNKCE